MNKYLLMFGFTTVLLFTGCESPKDQARETPFTSDSSSDFAEVRQANQLSAPRSFRAEGVIDLEKTQRELAAAVSRFYAAESKFGASATADALIGNSYYVDVMSHELEVVRRIEEMVSAYGGTDVQNLRLELESRRDRHLNRLKKDTAFIARKADYEAAMGYLDF